MKTKTAYSGPGTFSVDDLLMWEQSDGDVPWWTRWLWNWQCPYKLKCFEWLLIIRNKVLTWEVLKRRGLHRPRKVCTLLWGW